MKNLTGRFNLLISLVAGITAAKASHAASDPTPVSGGVTNEPIHLSQSSASAGAMATGTNAPASDFRTTEEDSFHVHAMPAAESKAMTLHPETFWRENTLLDDYGGWRSLMGQYGIELLPVYVGEVMGNPSGGQKQGTIYDSSLNLPLTVSLDKLFNGWNGGKMFANVVWIAGRSLSADYVGDISDTSNISGDDTVRVQELWYEQAFWQERATLRAGLLEADAEFFTSDTASLFISGTFGAFTLAGVNLPNPPFYPMAAPAVRFRIEPTPRFYFQTGVFKANSGTQEENRNGLDYDFNGDDGVLVFSEIGCRINQDKGELGLSGTYKLGAFVDTANFHNLNTRASEGPDYGIYAVADQTLYRQGSRHISFFTRGGGAPSDINTVNWYFDAGFNFAGFIPGRPDDTVGAAVARSWFSPDFQGTPSSGSTPPFSAETVVEATWRIRVTPWWTLQPDFQYIFNPGGAEKTSDATVIGLRTTIVF
jgi:porin